LIFPTLGAGKRQEVMGYNALMEKYLSKMKLISGTLSMELKDIGLQDSSSLGRWIQIWEPLGMIHQSDPLCLHNMLKSMSYWMLLVGSI